MYGANTIAEMGEMSLTGVTSETAGASSFGASVQKFFKVGNDDPGEVTFSGNYDPTDTNGQVALNALSNYNNGLTNLYFYDQYGAGTAGDLYTYWQVESGGGIFITNFNNFTLPLNNIGTVSFTGKVSGGYMEWVDTNA
jgi:hypothetical protein